MYKVIEEFIDLKDDMHVYKVGDTFPHDGREVSAKRIAELSGIQNRRKVAVIEEVKKSKAEPAVKEVKAEQESFMNEPVDAEPNDAEPVEDEKPRKSGKKK